LPTESSAQTSPPGARRPRPEVSDRLYRTALRRFRKHGFEETAVSSVTREADVAKGTFFNHFPTKEHLLARAFDEMMDVALAVDGAGGSDAITDGLDRLALELAGAPHLARVIVPRLGLLPPPPARDGVEPITGLERLRRWIRDRLAESLRMSVPLEETDDQTLSILVLSAFEATLREWIIATGGEPPFPRRLLHGRIAYLLATAGFTRPDLKG
jgi:AcrR family transcriptional regulator